MISSFRLPFNFDPEALRSDLDRIAPDEWVAHFNQDYFEGEWSGVALRSNSGEPLSTVFPSCTGNFVYGYADPAALPVCARAPDPISMYAAVSQILEACSRLADQGASRLRSRL